MTAHHEAGNQAMELDVLIVPVSRELHVRDK